MRNISKIEEIYKDYWEQKWNLNYFEDSISDKEFIFNAMKEYAEYYANQCLEIAERLGIGYGGNECIPPTKIILPPHQ
jgi:HEPN domain-containing protein